MKISKIIMIECIIKDIFIIVLLLCLFPSIHRQMNYLHFDIKGDILATLGLLLAGSVAGNFAFSYQKTKISSIIDRYLGHFTTFFLIFGIGLLIEITLSVINITPGYYYDPVVLSALIVFISIILYDIWDVFRLRHKINK